MYLTDYDDEIIYWGATYDDWSAEFKVKNDTCRKITFISSDFTVEPGEDGYIYFDLDLEYE